MAQITQFLPTHCERNHSTRHGAADWLGRGGAIDLTAGDEVSLVDCMRELDIAWQKSTSPYNFEAIVHGMLCTATANHGEGWGAVADLLLLHMNQSINQLANQQANMCSD